MFQNLTEQEKLCIINEITSELSRLLFEETEEQIREEAGQATEKDGSQV